MTICDNFAMTEYVNTLPCALIKPGSQNEKHGTEVPCFPELQSNQLTTAEESQTTLRRWQSCNGSHPTGRSRIRACQKCSVKLGRRSPNIRSRERPMYRSERTCSRSWCRL